MSKEKKLQPQKKGEKREVNHIEEYRRFLSEFESWVADDRRVKIASKYKNKRSDHFAIEVFAMFPDVDELMLMDPDFKTEVVMSRTWALPIAKVLIGNDQYETGSFITIGEEFGGWDYVRAYDDAVKLMRSRAAGHETGKPSVKNMPKLREILALAQWNRYRFSLKLMEREPQDKFTFYLHEREACYSVDANELLEEFKMLING
jgi:hypothetical protein